MATTAPRKHRTTKAKQSAKQIAVVEPQPAFTQDEVECCESIWVEDRFWFNIWKWSMETGELALVDCIGVDEYEDIHNEIQERYDWHPTMCAEYLNGVMFIPWPKGIPSPLQGIARTANRMKRHCASQLDMHLAFKEFEKVSAVRSPKE